MKLRNDKEINAFFASAYLGGGMAGMPYPPTKTPTDCTDTHRLGGKNAT